ncbi:hypothetical protein R3W88_012124 [Solanum pinnatisectum]|uniref:Uncharacterized protein n=1 Tax=Solanum pinnatisectum TaxID=50273 RepID=A0AAV9L8H5_9SOLN|nr:hypothetical protein R3W88_012124 [Solanum pinnatisectum]
MNRWEDRVVKETNNQQTTILEIQNQATNRQYQTNDQKHNTISSKIKIYKKNNVMNVSSFDHEENDSEHTGREESNSGQEENTNEQTGDDPTTEEEGSGYTSTADYESIERGNSDSDDEAEKLIQTFNNTSCNKEVEQTFQELTENINLSPRGKHTRGGKNQG